MTRALAVLAAAEGDAGTGGRVGAEADEGNRRCIGRGGGDFALSTCTRLAALAVASPTTTIFATELTLRVCV